jgi:hypothetical protein
MCFSFIAIDCFVFIQGAEPKVSQPARQSKQPAKAKVAEKPKPAEVKSNVRRPAKKAEPKRKLLAADEEEEELEPAFSTHKTTQKKYGKVGVPS